MRDFCRSDFVKVVVEARHPRILYLSVEEFTRLRDMTGATCKGADSDGEYVIIYKTFVRPNIGIMDLSECKFFTREDGNGDTQNEKTQSAWR